MNNSFLVDEKGFYGNFGGAYIPEILYATVENLRREYLPIEKCHKAGIYLM